MSGEPYSPDGTFPTFPLTLVKDGESYQFTSIMDGLFKKLINAVGFLKDNGPSLAGDNLVQLETRIIPRLEPLIAVTEDASLTDWQPASAWIWQQNTTSAATTKPLTIPLIDLPDYGTLKTVSVKWTGAGGHAAFPGGAPTMPKIQVFKMDVDGNETSLAAATSDSSATAGAYEAAHTIVTGTLNVTLDRQNFTYYVKVFGEAGGNFIAGSLVFAPRFTVEVDEMPEF